MLLIGLLAGTCVLVLQLCLKHLTQAAAVPSASLCFIVSPLMFFIFKLKRQLCIHAVMVLNKNTHLQSLLLRADLEKMFSPVEGCVYCFGKSAFECFILDGLL